MWIMMAVAHGASVTVSPGDDIGSVTSSLQAGDVVTFTAGRFELDGSVTWEAPGVEGNPIRFIGAPDGATVLVNLGGGSVANLVRSSHVEISDLVFEGFDPKKNNVGGLYIEDSTFVTVEDCIIRNIRGTGVRVVGESNNLTIRRNEIAESTEGTGILTGCSDGSCWLQDSVIEQNLIHDVASSGLFFYPGTQNVQILDNVVFRIGRDGLVLPDTQFGDQNIAQGNVLWQIEDDGIEIYGPALVQNNIVFETGDEGIFSYNNGDIGETLVNVQISHNTVARTLGYATLLQGWYDREQLVFANNVLSNATGRSLRYDDPRSDPDFYKNYGKDAPDTTNFIANNVVTGLIEGFDVIVRPDFVIEGGGVSDFVDIDNFDFYLSGVSQARDAGSPLGEAYIPVVDFNRVERDGLAPDAGAYEFVGERNPGWIIAETFKDVTPARPGNTALDRGCCSNEDGGEDAWMVAPLVLLAFLRRRRDGSRAIRSSGRSGRPSRSGASS